MYNTGNPIGSTALKDLSDNAQNLDIAVNDLSRNTWTDRFGVERPTLAAATDPTGLVQEAVDAKVLAESARDAAMTAAGPLYESESEGRAAVADGDSFRVVGTGDTAVSVYRRISASQSQLLAEIPTTLAVQEAGFFAIDAHLAKLQKSISKYWPWAITDVNNNVLLGVDEKGYVSARFEGMPGQRCLSPYAWAITDSQGYVLLGVRWTGETDGYSLQSDFVAPAGAYVDGPEGHQSIFVLIDGIPHQITSTGDCFEPIVSNGTVKYIARNNGIEVKEEILPEYGQIAPYVQKIYHVIGSGQSLGLGTGSSLVTTQPPLANRFYTIKYGMRLTNVDAILPEGEIYPWIPMVGKVSETPITQACAQIARNNSLPSNAGLLASFHGRGGARVEHLAKGTQYYANSITAIQKSKEYADILGLEYVVPCIDWIQGEANRMDATGVYYNNMLQLQADYESDIKAITGQQGRIPIVLCQIHNWTSYGLTESNVPLEQLQLALDYPDRFVCAGPKYWASTNADGVHLPSINSQRLGVQHSQFIQSVIEGAYMLPTYCISAKRTGYTIDLVFNTPKGKLVVDNLNVTDPGNLGLRYVDSTNSAVVQSVKLLGNNVVRVTLNQEPTGSDAYIGIADVGIAGNDGGPTTGPRACLRDSDFVRDMHGNPVYNWACVQRISVN